METPRLPPRFPLHYIVLKAREKPTMTLHEVHEEYSGMLGIPSKTCSIINHVPAGTMIYGFVDPKITPREVGLDSFHIIVQTL